ncbi:hypothetical protein CERZMDRAFT_98119 [Cercospora zeae-maydis SCOH1-5]|uniref:Major facilitator superfamily (MFS) profile domain-containing protein n=1 Tax=Cercospora zeae-maydis SCOH1-5 TaxID=717836 RepID=A0A6A6FDX2_9PEZI|nr:hypothetical protein CERZMDRAFT_98119 [Cercospora zeae-maydis SCOH1-5]
MAVVGSQVQTAAAITPRPPLASRKKLPWLDVAGAVAATEPRPITSGHDQQSQQISTSTPPAVSTQYVSSNTLSDDLRFRPTGSTHEIRDHGRSREPRAYSQTSQRPAGLRSRPIVKSKPGLDHRPFTYASSEYSTTTPSDREALPAGFPRKDPASYEKLVRSPHSPDSALRDAAIQNVRPATAPKKNEAPRQGKGTTRWKPHPSSHRVGSERLHIQDGTKHIRRDVVATVAPPSDTTSRGLSSSPMPATRSSLYALPPHLMAPSGSSSPDSDYAQLNGTSRKAATLPDRPSLAVAEPKILADSEERLAQCGVGVARPDEAEIVLQGTTRALTGLSNKRAAKMRPLKLSQTESMRSSEDGGVSSSASVRRRKTASLDISAPMEGSKIGTRPHPLRLLPLLRDPSRTRHNVNAQQLRLIASTDDSVSRTPPRLYHPPSADSIIRDFAYTGPKYLRRHSTHSLKRTRYGAAASYYGDHGESVATQPGIRPSICVSKPEAPLPSPSPREWCCGLAGKHQRVHRAHAMHNSDTTGSKVPIRPLRRTRAGLQNASRSADPLLAANDQTKPSAAPSLPPATGAANAAVPAQTSKPARVPTTSSDAEAVDLSLKHPRLNHISVKEGEEYYLRRHHRPEPIAREWSLARKRLTSFIACLNTIFVGLIAGIYAGEVPRIQYQLDDESHWVIFGNMLLFAGLGLSTLVAWPLPLLHGRRPYILVAFGIMLPLQIPQAMVVQRAHGSGLLYKIGILLPRGLTGLALGFANVNFLPTLQGGGIGAWLGLWTFCFGSSLSIGFFAGACIISKLNPSWGFWISIMLLSFFLLVNMIAPETRKDEHRRSLFQFFEDKEARRLKHRIARGEVKLHLSNDGPKYWYEEVWAGIILTKRMVLQPGFFVLMLYLGWIQAQLTLVILLLGALLSRDYEWASHWVGLAALSVPIGAALAVPLTNASTFSRARVKPPRTDSMTFQEPRVTWTSHLFRRTVFTLLLPFAGLGFCLSSPGPPLHWSAAVIFAGLVGFLADLGTAECVGLIMESFDTCDLQPGVNTRHRVQSMSAQTRRRRTNYSSFPRVCAGWFAAQSLGFFLAAGATVAAGRVTDNFGAQTSISIVAAILLGVTVLLLIVLWRWNDVQVIPSFTSGTATGSKEFGDSSQADPEWRPVVIGRPSGKMRRMNLLEMGAWSRWTEIRKLNKLVKG